MTSRNAGVAVIVLGVGVSAWAWFGVWPLNAPVFGPAADYSGLHGLSFAIAIFGLCTSFVGLVLAVAGRGGPDEWDTG
jgi:hypothetical protein